MTFAGALCAYSIILLERFILGGFPYLLLEVIAVPAIATGQLKGDLSDLL
jgi:hypothetical protein